LNGSEAAQWKKAMDEQMAALMKFKTVFKRKLNSENTTAKYKARLVAKGYLQIAGRDYNEVFASVAQYKMYDFESAFLNWPIDRAW